MQVKKPDLHSEVFVDQQVGRFEVPVYDGRPTGMQIIHSLGDIEGHAHLAPLVQGDLGRPVHPLLADERIPEFARCCLPNWRGHEDGCRITDFQSI